MNFFQCQVKNIRYLIIYICTVNGSLTDLFEPLLGKIYSHITSSFLVTSELFHVF